MSDSLWPCELQFARFPIPSPAPRVCSTHVHWVSDAIQPSHPLSSPSPTALNLSQHQSLFQWVGSLHQVVKILELQHQSFIFLPYHTLFESLSLKENVELPLATVGISVWFWFFEMLLYLANKNDTDHWFLIKRQLYPTTTISFYFPESFNKDCCSVLSNAFSGTIDRIWFFIFNLLMKIFVLIDFLMLCFVNQNLLGYSVLFLPDC